MIVPPTSISLLKDLSNGAGAVRWTEFFRRYEPMMRAFLAARFPSVDADDAIQETLISLTKALPEYRYTPDGNGHFRNYLVGIVRHKALDAIRRRTARDNAKAAIAEEERMRAAEAAQESGEDDDWRRSAMEAALDQMFADDSISPRTREVFRHVAIMHEKPEDVARLFGITRNGVDQIKSRMVARLAKLVGAMTA